MHQNIMRFLLLLLMIIVSCSDSEVVETVLEENETSLEEKIIFGYYFGNCIGEECMETFKIEEGRLFEDLNDDYSRKSYDFIELSNILYIQVVDLFDDVPIELKTAQSQTFGCPDCLDQGGVYLQLYDSVRLNNSREFFIDQDKINTPKYLHNFVDSLNQKIALLQ